MAENVRASGRESALRRLAKYERPWVGRVGLGLGLMLWLFVTAVAFGAGLANGLVVLIMGGALIFGEVWIERGSGERHATMASVWRLSLRVAMGVTLVVLALVNADGSGAALLILFGAWLILAGLVLGAVLLRETREQGRKP